MSWCPSSVFLHCRGHLSSNRAGKFIFGACIHTGYGDTPDFALWTETTPRAPTYPTGPVPGAPSGLWRCRGGACAPAGAVHNWYRRAADHKSHKHHRFRRLKPQRQPVCFFRCSLVAIYLCLHLYDMNSRSCNYMVILRIKKLNNELSLSPACLKRGRWQVPALGCVCVWRGGGLLGFLCDNMARVAPGKQSWPRAERLVERCRPLPPSLKARLFALGPCPCLLAVVCTPSQSFVTGPPPLALTCTTGLG